MAHVITHLQADDGRIVPLRSGDLVMLEADGTGWIGRPVRDLPAGLVELEPFNTVSAYERGEPTGPPVVYHRMSRTVVGRARCQ